MSVEKIEGDIPAESVSKSSRGDLVLRILIEEKISRVMKVECREPNEEDKKHLVPVEADVSVFKITLPKHSITGEVPRKDLVITSAHYMEKGLLSRGSEDMLKEALWETEERLIFMLTDQVMKQLEE